MKTRTWKQYWTLAVLSLAWVLAGCGGGSTAAPAAASVAISVSPSSASLDQGTTQQFTATVTGSSNHAVTWSMQEASGGTITNAGMYTSPATTGTFHIIATSQADPTKTAMATVTIVQTSVVVQPAVEFLAFGGSRKFSAVTTGGELNLQVTWSVPEPGGGTITTDGLYTAPSQLGTFHVVATSTANSQVQGTAIVTVVGSGFVQILGNFDEQDELSDLTATLLEDGRALIIGGLIDCISNEWTSDCTAPFTVLRSAQIYDSLTRTFSFTGSLANGRYGHTATLLQNGKVLVVGGFDSYCICSAPVTTAEIFDPATGSFSPAGAPQMPRAYHTATLLADGTVLIVGGVQGVPDLLAGGSVPALASAEIYDPGTNRFNSVGGMANRRMNHTATLLPSGMALIVGGAPVSIGGPGTAGDATAELYDPIMRAFSPAGAMAMPRFGHTATLLPTGNVLVAGGSASGETAPVFSGRAPTASVEIFNPQTKLWSTAPAMNSPRAFHTATLLHSGQVLFAGDTQESFPHGRAELYDPQSGASAPAGSLVAGWRWRHVATLMPDGSVLVVGGVTGIIELYQGAVPPASGN